MRILLAALSGILISLCAAKGPAQDNAATRLFKPYPKSSALDYIMQTHQDQSWRLFGYDFPKDRRAEVANPPLVVYATWFLRGEPTIAMQCTVDAFGRVNTVRSCYNWAEQNCQESQITLSQLTLLRRDVSALPAGEPSPPLKRLLIVSFYRGGRWTTRLYDRGHPPMPVRKVYDIAGVDPFRQPVTPGR